MTATPADYFDEQISTHLAGEMVESSGYFRSRLRPSTGPALFGEATEAKGYFLALTKTRLMAVVTRAPATRTPLHNNQGVFIIPRDAIGSVEMTTDALVISSGEASLAVELWLRHPAFPKQPELLQELLDGYGDGRSIEAVDAARRRAKMLRLGLVLTALLAGLLFASLR